MEWLLLSIGAIMGFLIAVLSRLPPKAKRPTPQAPDHQRLLYHYIRDYHLGRPLSRITMERQPFSTAYQFRTPIDSRISRAPFTDGLRPDVQRIGDRQRNMKFLVENWRRSIVGLVRLAERNLRIAEHYLEMENYGRAVEVAFTGVENMSRALIHCYGGKPDPDPGQEEALKLICQRFSKDEKAEFEKAINKVAHITQCKTSLPYQVEYISGHNIQIRPLDKKETKEILESASNVVSSLKRTIADHFATEIPELDEICPSAHAFNR